MTVTPEGWGVFGLLALLVALTIFIRWKQRPWWRRWF